MRQYTIRDLYQATGSNPVDVYRWVDRGWIRWEHRGAGSHNKGRRISEKDILVAKALTVIPRMMRGASHSYPGMALRSAIANALNDADDTPGLLSLTQDKSGNWQAEVRSEPDLSRPSTVIDLDALRASINRDLQRGPELSL